MSNPFMTVDSSSGRPRLTIVSTEEDPAPIDLAGALDIATMDIRSAVIGNGETQAPAVLFRLEGSDLTTHEAGEAFVIMTAGSVETFAAALLEAAGIARTDVAPTPARS